MKRNMGIADRLIRMIVAIAIIIFYFKGLVTGTIAPVLLVFAGIFIITSFFAFCPVYSLFGISTCSTKKLTNEKSNRSV